MTVATEDLVDSASIAAASTKRKSLWLVALRNPMVIIGGSILLIMLAIAVLAPFLGTVDPTRIDPASRNKKPGTEITMRLDDGTRPSSASPSWAPTASAATSTAASSTARACRWPSALRLP